MYMCTCLFIAWPVLKYRYGYRSLDELIDVVQQYDAHGIPLEVVWSDLDYTDRWGTGHMGVWRSARRPAWGVWLHSARHWAVAIGTKRASHPTPSAAPCPLPARFAQACAACPTGACHDEARRRRAAAEGGSKGAIL